MKKNLLIMGVLLLLWPVCSGADKSLAAPGSGMDQMSQPFQAFAGLELKGSDFYYQKEGADPQKIGNVVFTYDVNGKVIGYEYTVTNVAPGLFSNVEWIRFVPQDATIKVIYEDTEDGMNENIYYLDSEGIRHDIGIASYTYYGMEVVSCIEKSLNDDGVMTEYEKAESVFDDKGRPLTTITYKDYSYVDTLTGKKTFELKPYKRVTYRYGSGTLVTKAVAYMSVDKQGNEFWLDSNRLTTGVDADGYEWYEYMVYQDGEWSGSYKSLEEHTVYADGSEDILELTWTWDSPQQGWVQSGKTFYKWNKNNRLIFSETYKYDTLWSAFYPVRQSGHEFIGDTLECVSWLMYFYKPDSYSQLSDKYSYAYNAEKQEFEFYTLQELGWPSEYGHYDGYDNRKYEISYVLGDCTDSAVWVMDSKTEYEYVLRPDYWGDMTFTVSDKKKTTFDHWTGQVFSTSQEKHEFDSHGYEVLSETYENGVLISRNIWEIEQYTYIDDEGDSVTEARETRQERWVMNWDSVLVCDELREYNYDEAGRTIVEAYRSGWNMDFDTWMGGHRVDHGYDEEGNDTLNADYSWEMMDKCWSGYKSKVIRDDDGEVLLSESYKVTLSDDGSTVVVPYEFTERKKDAAGRLISELRYQYWDIEHDTWYSGVRTEYTYSDAGLEIMSVTASMRGGVWYNYSKETSEYDAQGHEVLRLTYGYDIDWYVKGRKEMTYTESGKLKDYYTYELDGEELRPDYKMVSKVTEGRIVETCDSVYQIYDSDGSGNVLWRWEPSANTEYTYDDATGNVTILRKEWSSYECEWKDYSKEVIRENSEGLLNFYERYYPESISLFDNDGMYRGDTVVWVGNEKFEREYDARGATISDASYYWDYYGMEWVGERKEEEAYDPISDNTILEARYIWDSERKDWRGYGSKREYAYDSKGREILKLKYEWDEDEWCWAGVSKYETIYSEDGNSETDIIYSWNNDKNDWVLSEKDVYYTVDGCAFQDEYEWDAVKNDWRGTRRYEYSSNYEDNVEVDSRYKWNETDWCWEGVSRCERRFTDNGRVYIYYAWNKAQSKWELDRRESVQHSYRSDYNLEYELSVNEIYDISASDWKLSYSLKAVYIYDVSTDVAQVTSDADISVYDGQIIVTADDDSPIRIFTASGAYVTSGQGSVTVGVASGTYLINVGGKTTKIIVR